ncbi:transcription termination/antitermination protein NusG [Caldicellulosiruptoraceae bacterium PP1]
MSDKRAKWYVVHTYSGYENKVKANLEKIIENRNLNERIVDIQIPTEIVFEVKNGKQVKKEKKKFPSYVLIKAIMDNEIWYIIRNVSGVTGFVGPDSKPTPLTEEEIETMGIKDQVIHVLDYDVGDSVKVISGPFSDFYGSVMEINKEKNKVKVVLNLFGRETPVELDFNQVEKY